MGGFGSFPGSEAPEFTLPSQEARWSSSKDYRGKSVALYFYPKDFTSGCTIGAHNFQRKVLYQGKRAVVLGVSLDSAGSHKQFCAQQGLNFKLLADTDDKVTTTYDSRMGMGAAKLAARHTFIVNPEGKIVRVYENVKPNQHSKKVLPALGELQK